MLLQDVLNQLVHSTSCGLLDPNDLLLRSWCQVTQYTFRGLCLGRLELFGQPWNNSVWFFYIVIRSGISGLYECPDLLL